MNKAAQERLIKWMEEKNFIRFFLARPENFAWLTGGGDSTVIAGEGVAWLEVVEGKIKLHTSRIEAKRMLEEEVPGIDEVVSYPWYAVPKLASPNDLEYDLTPLRLVLSQEEQERFRALGRDTACAIGEALQEAKPTWTEQELAGALSEALHVRGIQPLVLLVAGEERIFKYRHPLPKDAPLGRLCMAVTCGRRQGLVADVTRMRSWGHPHAEALYRRVLQVEAAALDSSRPGTTLSTILTKIKQAYVSIGYPEAFEDHHQGGIAGYRPREVIATPGKNTILKPGMALAWNPSLPGAKVEDTVLVAQDGIEILTYDPTWPAVEVAGRLRPTLLEG